MYCFSISISQVHVERDRAMPGFNVRGNVVLFYSIRGQIRQSHQLHYMCVVGGGVGWGWR